MLCFLVMWNLAFFFFNGVAFVEGRDRFWFFFSPLSFVPGFNFSGQVLNQSEVLKLIVDLPVHWQRRVHEFASLATPTLNLAIRYITFKKLYVFHRN